MNRFIALTHCAKLRMAILVWACCLLLTGVSSASTLFLPRSLRVIEDEAFFGNAAIDEVVLPEGMQAIGERAFANSSAASILLPSSIKQIGEDAFQNTQVVGTGLPGTYAHQWFEEHGLAYIAYSTPIEDFEWETINGIEARIVRYTGGGSIAVIPEMIEDYDIIEIGEGAFMGHAALESVYIPGSVKTIGCSAFRNCTRLSAVSFSAGLKAIKADAFRSCTSLSYVDFPDTLETIGDGAFRDCSSLADFHYPAGLKHCDENVFRDCESLVSYEVPEGVTFLSEGLFYNTNTLRQVSLPSTLTDIGDAAFRNCVSLGSIALPDGLQTIHKNAFQACVLIESIEMPDSMVTLESHAFQDCTALKTVVYSERLKDIGAGAFWNCTSLTEANLPDSLEGLGESAFGECVNLASFRYPLGLDHRNSEHDNGYLYDGRIFYNCKKLRKITVPESVTKVPDGIFMGSNYLREVELPSTVTTIESNAFKGCVAMRSIVIPNGVEEIGSHAFEGCIALSSVTFPDQLKSIGAAAFSGTALTQANLPDSVEGLGEHAFYGCAELSSFHYPANLDHLNSIHDNGYVYEGKVFYDCPKLTDIEIPDGVTRIPDLMFAGCNTLRNVTIPNTVSEFGGGGVLGGGAFSDCVAMERLYVSPNVTIIPEDTFAGCSSITIWCEYGSAALRHCREREIPYYYLTPDGVNSPKGTLYQGDHYGLHGYARASIPIAEITATIWNSDRSEALQTITVRPGQTDYSITDLINYRLSFGVLPLGTYHYTLHASTAISEEDWADTTFRVEPQPLRISISNLTLPYGLEAADFSIGGRIVSNYAISQVKVTIYRPDHDEEVKNVTVSPGTVTYDLAALNEELNLASYAEETLAIQIIATSHGQTRTLKDTDLALRTKANIVLDGRKTQTLVEFASDEENRSIFTTAYIDEVIDDMSWVEDGIMCLGNILNISIFDRLENLLVHAGKRQDLIDLYKKEIVQLIQDGAYEQFDIAGTANECTDNTLSILKEGGKLAKEAFKEHGKTKSENFMGSVNELLSSLKDALSTAEAIEEAYETIAVICGRYEAGLYVLDYMGSCVDAASRAEFDEALDILRAEFASAQAAVVYEHQRIIKELAISHGEKAILDELKLLLRESFGQNYSIDLPKLFAKLTMKATGLDEVDNTYSLLFVRQDLLNVAIHSYTEAFDRVHGGDHSEAALLRLARAISITKTAWVRANDLITKLPRYAYTVGNAYLDYRYNGSISVLLTSSDFD